MEGDGFFESGEDYIAANSDDLLAALSTVTPSPPSRDASADMMMNSQGTSEWEHNHQEHQQDNHYHQHHQNHNNYQQQQQQMHMQEQQMRQLMYQQEQQRQLLQFQQHQQEQERQQQLRQQQQHKLVGIIEHQIPISNNYEGGNNTNPVFGNQNGVMLNAGQSNNTERGQATSFVATNGNQAGISSMDGFHYENQHQNNIDNSLNTSMGVANTLIPAGGDSGSMPKMMHEGNGVSQSSQWFDEQKNGNDDTVSMKNLNPVSNAAVDTDTLVSIGNTRENDDQRQLVRGQHRSLIESSTQQGATSLSNDNATTLANDNFENGLSVSYPDLNNHGQPDKSANTDGDRGNANSFRTLSSTPMDNDASSPLEPSHNKINTQQSSLSESNSDVCLPAAHNENSSDAPSTMPKQALHVPPPNPADSDVIELLDDEDDNEEHNNVQNASNKRARLSPISDRTPSATAVGAHMSRNANMPLWMKRSSGQGTPIPIPGHIPGVPPNSLSSVETAAMIQHMYKSNPHHRRMLQQEQFDPPQYVLLPPEFVPRWSRFLPRPKRKEFRSFELTLLNVREFTITGLPVSFDGKPSSVAGLRSEIKRISKQCGGKAVYDRNADLRDENGDEIEDGENYNNNVSPEEGRWRIPLAAYHAFYAYLSNDPMVRVEGIPENQLKIASLGKARLEKGYPSVKKLLSYGIPKGLATTLAPFQRGGVDFVVEKGGRALIADDMGLGKTIQAVASVSVYHDEWPVLVLTPSSARYHWESEFQNWLGAESNVNKQVGTILDDTDASGDNESSESHSDLHAKPCMTLLQDSEIHVLTASKEAVLPTPRTRVVICSYGLAPSLVESGKIKPGDFRCAIVDESHMLKNISTKRTSTLVPILHATNRCILLSGTPALARPSELWPQLKILSTEESGWWDDEAEFVKNYVKRTSAARRAELHTMLTGTVMIRRLKNEILKSLPRKFREKAIVDVSTDDMRREFHQCLVLLREGKGVLGKLARQHTSLAPPPPAAEEADTFDSNSTAINGDSDLETAIAALRQECRERIREQHEMIRHTIETTNHQLSEAEKEDFFQKMDANVRSEVGVYYRERLHGLKNGTNPNGEDKPSRATVLSKMYTLTAKAKIPLVVDMLKRWLDDPTKGKLCIFAHHIFVLDAIVAQVGLSNEASSNRRFIRIDGSTSPKDRQAQIKEFQNNPSVKIAVLGITAAGVAVTLTAASTVWFAELFWTPALMIQAEDRCHRIGQNSRVECLYFVASGTLDEILWKLLEKKFKDLGEFVEGKEKLKLVIERTYTGLKELHAIFSTPADDDEEDDRAVVKSDGDDEILDLEMDLQQDIAELGKEELTMMLPADTEEDEVDLVAESKTQQSRNLPSNDTDGRGKSEEDAILLSDDEEDEEAAKPTGDAGGVIESDGAKPGDSGGSFNRTFNFNAPLPKCRIYTMTFPGPSFGIQLRLHERRAVVCTTRSPQNGKPAVGDIVVALNGQHIEFIDHLSMFLNILKASIARDPPVRLTFAEDETFTKYYTEVVLPAEFEIEKQQELHRQQLKQLAAQQRPKADSNEVIELLDDDDD